MLPTVARCIGLGLVLSTVQAILVSPGSPCGMKCGNVLDSTSVDDLVCRQGDFASSFKGQLFSGCINCQKASTYYRGNDSDIQAMLYNLRLGVSYCLLGNVPRNPNAINSPCITSKACGPFKNAIEYGNMSSQFDAYQYCDLWPTNDSLDFQGCQDCLQAEGRHFLANFVIALQAGCLQKPAAGLYIGLDGELFSSTPVRISTPSPTATVDPNWFDQGPLTLGAKVGIAIGGIIALLILLGCCIVCNGRRRRRAVLRRLDTKSVERGWPTSDGQREMNEAYRQQPSRGWDDTPLSQRPLKGWDDSPVTSHSEKTFPRYFSPYSSQYNSPVNEAEAQNVTWPQTAVPAAHAPSNHEIRLAVGAADGSASHSSVKGKAREESYEMHEVESSTNGSSKGAAKAPRIEQPVPRGMDGNVYQRV